VAGGGKERGPLHRGVTRTRRDRKNTRDKIIPHEPFSSRKSGGRNTFGERGGNGGGRLAVISKVFGLGVSLKGRSRQAANTSRQTPGGSCTAGLHVAAEKESRHAGGWGSCGFL